MRYGTSKEGIMTAIIGTLNSKAQTTQNVLVNFDKNSLRKMVGDFIKKQIKRMKPDAEMVMWKTSVGEFCIYKESSLDYCFEPIKSKYKHIETKLEFAPKKGKIKTIVIKSRRFVNQDYEGFDECPNCNKKGLLDYTIVRREEKIKVCKKCKDFDKLLDKIEKKLKAEDKDPKKK